jgi:hypothetical protein
MKNDSSKRELPPGGRSAAVHEYLRNNPEELKQFAVLLQSIARGVRARQREWAESLAPVIESANAWHASIAPEQDKLATWLGTIDWPETERRLGTIGELLECIEASVDPGAKRLYEFLNDTSLQEVWEMMPYLKRPSKRRGRKPGRTKLYDETQRQAVANLTADGRDAGELFLSEIAAEIARLSGRTGPQQKRSIARNLYRQK